VEDGDGNEEEEEEEGEAEGGGQGDHSPRDSPNGSKWAAPRVLAEVGKAGSELAERYGTTRVLSKMKIELGSRLGAGPKTPKRASGSGKGGSASRASRLGAGGMQRNSSGSGISGSGGGGSGISGISGGGSLLMLDPGLMVAAIELCTAALDSLGGAVADETVLFVGAGGGGGAGAGADAEEDASAESEGKVIAAGTRPTVGGGTGTLGAAAKSAGPDDVDAMGGQTAVTVEQALQMRSQPPLAEDSAALETALDRSNVWEFSAFELEEASGGRPLWALGRYLFYSPWYDFGSSFLAHEDEQRKMDKFMQLVDASYIPNPYHNATHGADVLQGVHYFIRRAGLYRFMDEVETLALLVAAAVHDIAHPGLNATFLAATRCTLSVRYNDRNTLEMHHAYTAFRLLWSRECDWTSVMKTDTQRKLRALMVEFILATDLKEHFRIVSEFRATRKVDPASVSGRGDQPLHGTILDACMSDAHLAERYFAEDAKKRLALSIAIKCADVSHPTRPWHVHRQWSSLVTEEFFQQGDREKALGLPVSPFSDRDDHNLPKSQCGFISFMIQPLFDEFVSFVANSAVSLPLRYMDRNKDRWERIRDGKASDGFEVETPISVGDAKAAEDEEGEAEGAAVRSSKDAGDAKEAGGGDVETGQG